MAMASSSSVSLPAPILDSLGPSHHSRCSSLLLPSHLRLASHARLLRQQVVPRRARVPASTMQLLPGVAKASLSELHDDDGPAVVAVGSSTAPQEQLRAEEQLGAEADGVVAAAAQDSPRLDRRQLLAASMASLPLLSSSTRPQAARASLVSPPDLSQYQDAYVSSTESVSCFLPLSTTDPKDFVPKDNISQLKTRSAAHLVDADYMAKYNKAYEKMRALDDSDPRSFKQQADVHCAFCNGAYTVSSTNTADLQIHFSWLFYPWHRYYLYFHERILAKLIDDPSFSLAYWNWDDQSNGGNYLPSMFKQQSTYPSLYDTNRRTSSSTSINTLSVSDASSTTVTDSDIIANNLSEMYQSVVSATTPSLFFGTTPLFEDLNDSTASGSMESGPHTAIHVWVGNPSNTNLENMGNFYSAGRDPAFYSHHANVDRIWTVWNNIPGTRRTTPTDDDFRNSSFVFYNEDAELVKVYVKDCLDSVNQLGISYTTAPDEQWLNLQTKPRGTKGVVPKAVASLAAIDDTTTRTITTEVLTSVSALVARPTNLAEFATSNNIEKGAVEEVLVLQDVTVPSNAATHVAVFLNLPTAGVKTPVNNAEFVGSFTNVPHAGRTMNMNKRDVRFGISNNITRLGLSDQTSISVTAVAKVAAADKGKITVGGFKIEYE